MAKVNKILESLLIVGIEASLLFPVILLFVYLQMNNDDLITLNSNSQNKPKMCRALCEKLNFFFKDPHSLIFLHY